MCSTVQAGQFLWLFYNGGIMVLHLHSSGIFPCCSIILKFSFFLNYMFSDMCNKFILYSFIIQRFLLLLYTYWFLCLIIGYAFRYRRLSFLSTVKGSLNTFIQVISGIFLSWVASLVRFSSLNFFVIHTIPFQCGLNLFQ